jgi:FAD/FMN-containing dehydrogenase/NAD-dependent dihydropyrimidine dehydrogenase PreA subunit
MPYFVVQPESEDDVKKVFRFANERNIPVIARGAASWGLGGVIPAKSGIVIDMSPLRKIIALDVKNKTVTVQAGARWSDVDVTVKKEGLALMTYPSSKFSTVAGWIATGGWGINNFRYGHISKQVEGIKVITPAGEVKTLKHDDPEFKYFISTEGQFGIIFEVTLKLRENPKESYIHLLYFENNEKAFEFIEKLIENRGASNPVNGFNPNMLRFLDGTHLQDTNEVLHAKVFEESPAVLIELKSRGDEQKILSFISKQEGIKEAPHYVANYLWNERLFGMKTKRLGPTILASEITIPINKSAEFIKKAKNIGKNFGVDVGIDSYVIDNENALIMPNFLCDSRKLKYFVNLPLVAMLTRLGVSMGAKPYGLGIWNSPFIKSVFNPKEISELRDYKKKVDPKGIMNPGKFFGVKSKWLGIPSIAFKPVVFNPAMNIMIIFSPVIGRIATLLFGRDKKIDALDIELSTHACAKCGNCIAVCPAYLITGNEAVTAKGKVALAKKLAEGKNITKEEADNAFLCMHCKACEDVCQTNLELMRLWDAVEKNLEGKFGRPEDKIIEFLKKIDESKEYWEMVERNS